MQPSRAGRLAALSATPDTLRFDDYGAVPNSRLPVLLYRGVAAAREGPDACEAMFARNGWPPQWRSGVLPYHHFHSTAHEALGIVAGRVVVTLGGPAGEQVELAAGDVVVLPAGTGHRRESALAGLLVVGAYPPGQTWDMREGDPAEHDEVVANVARVPRPATDPVHGAAGPLVALWRGGT